MSARWISLVVTLLIGFVLSGCRPSRGVRQMEVDETLAPTSLPLPTASPEASMTASTTASSMPPSPTTQTTSLSTTPSATRIISPQEKIGLPPGFGVSVFAQGLDVPRMMALGSDGELYVAERGAGRIVRLPDRDADGLADAIEVVAKGLKAPSSIAFHPDGSLYVGETTRILRLSDPNEAGFFQTQEIVIEGLPSGGHSTRTVLLSPDGQYLYVSIGSSCNACIESDERRATIMRYNTDGTGARDYAQGIRNAVGIIFRPGTEELPATNNGRDRLGDDQPPETIYQVEKGDDAGWPRCHAARIIDPEYGQPGDCEGVAEPVVEMQAHSAPLGLAFYTGEQFAEAYRGDLFVAFHGSWNRSVPTGYKVVRVPMVMGEPEGVQDFAVGWLREDGSYWGRPVDLLSSPNGDLFISDDGGGIIYRTFYTP